VPYDFRDTLRRELDEKRAKLPIYLDRCDQCWPLVGATGDVPSSFVDLEGGTASAYFDFAFERTFFLDAFRGQAFELKRRVGTA
jgi:hypothetical protein